MDPDPSTTLENRDIFAVDIEGVVYVQYGTGINKIKLKIVF
jgi:hypothetical protein